MYKKVPTSLPNSAHIVISAVVIPTHSRARASTPVIDLFSVANNRASYEKYLLVCVFAVIMEK